jgi:hypothetical protein
MHINDIFNNNNECSLIFIATYAQKAFPNAIIPNTHAVVSNDGIFTKITPNSVNAVPHHRIIDTVSRTLCFMYYTYNFFILMKVS